jgi:hypothetical protein
MKLKWVALVSMLATASSFAAGIDGTWLGTLDAPGGAIEIKYQFVADGKKLTGTTASPDGMEIKIKEGKIDGGNLTFTVDIDLGGNPLTFNYTGVLAGEELKLHTEFMGQPLDFVLKKQKT